MIITVVVNNGASWFAETADECVVNCHGVPYASCVNVPGDYQCTCAAGYGGDGHTCTGTINQSINQPIIV